MTFDNSSVAVVGSIAIDDIQGPFGSHNDVLGGSASYASLASSYFAPKTQLIGIVGTDMPSKYLDLFKARDIDMSGLQTEEGNTFKWVGKYADDLLTRETIDTRLGVFGDYSPELPQAHKDAPLLLLGNIHPDLQLHVRKQVTKPQLVAMDTMNFWIEGAADSLAEILTQTDLLILNDEEARQLSREHSLTKAAQRIFKMGPKLIIIKRGDAGARFFYNDNVFAIPAVPLAKVEDPTGAGDTFAGALMGYLARCRSITTESIKTGIVVGSIMASLAVEHMSVAGLIDVDMKVVQERQRKLIDITKFLPADL